MRTSIDEHTMLLLCVQTLFLFEEDKGRSSAERNSKNHETDNKTENAICYDKAEDGSTNGTCSPSDVASLESHKFKWLLETLERGIAHVLIFVYFYWHDVFLLLER